MEIFATIITGVVVFVFGQIVQQFILMPIKEFNKERGDTSYLLLRYQPSITNASGRDTKALDDIHEMGASLISTLDQIPLYDFISSISVFGLPSRNAVDEAAREVNGIVCRTRENSKTGASDNVLALRKIADLLGVRTSF
jgi:hypothetical protein